MISAVISRRQFSLHIPATAVSAAVVIGGATSPQPAYALIPSTSPIADRFESDILTSPPITAGTKLTGHANLYFPSWMEGDWDATQTLLSTEAPVSQSSVDTTR